MKNRSQRAMSELYDRTDKIPQLEIKSPTSDLEQETGTIKEAKSPKMKTESGTCNVCSAPCSSCLHRNFSFTDCSSSHSSCKRVETDTCSFVDTCSEMGNLQSTTSSQSSSVKGDPFDGGTGSNFKKVLKQGVECNGDNSSCLTKDCEKDCKVLPDTERENVKKESNLDNNEKLNGYEKCETKEGDQVQSQGVVDGKNVEPDGLIDVKVCDICGDAGREELLATCSRCSDGAEHTYCMRVKLEKLPEEDWMCEECQFAESEKEKKKKSQLPIPSPRSETRIKNKERIGNNSDYENTQPRKKSRVTTCSVDVAVLQRSSKDPIMSPRISNNINNNLSRENSIKDPVTSPRMSNYNSNNFSHENSIKGFEMGKLKQENSNKSKALSRSYSLNSVSRTQPELPPPPPPPPARGLLTKHLSFKNLNMKTKIKQLTENITSKPKTAKVSILKTNREEGPVKEFTKLPSFKGGDTSSSNNDSLAKQMQVQQPFKEKKNLLERKGSFKFENRSSGMLAKPSSFLKKTEVRTGGNGNGEDAVRKTEPDTVRINKGTGTGDKKPDLRTEKPLERNNNSEEQKPNKPVPSKSIPSKAIPILKNESGNKLKSAIKSAVRKTLVHSKISEPNKFVPEPSKPRPLNSPKELPSRTNSLDNLPLKVSAEEKQKQLGPNAVSTKVKDLDVKSGDTFRATVIPEHDFVWLGSFEILHQGKPSEIFEGFQAHLSNCVSPKVVQVVNKCLTDKVQFEAVPRAAAWPMQFCESNPSEDNIALFFFAKDIQSYEVGYKKVLGNMMREDLALKRDFSGVELLIFPSDKLPLHSQRWNSLFFLWGVFRARRQQALRKLAGSTKPICGPHLSFPGPICGPHLSSPKTLQSKKEKADEADNKPQQDKEPLVSDRSRDLKVQEEGSTVSASWPHFVSSRSQSGTTGSKVEDCSVTVGPTPSVQLDSKPEFVDSESVKAEKLTERERSRTPDLNQSATECTENKKRAHSSEAISDESEQHKKTKYKNAPDSGNNNSNFSSNKILAPKIHPLLDIDLEKPVPESEDDVIHFVSSDREEININMNIMERNTPTLDFALGGNNKNAPQKEVLPWFLAPAGGRELKRNNDVVPDLSLTLGPPGSDREREERETEENNNNNKQGVKMQQFLPERPGVKKSLLLFGGYMDSLK